MSMHDWMNSFCAPGESWLANPFKVIVDGETWAIATNGYAMVALQGENEFPVLDGSASEFALAALSDNEDSPELPVVSVEKAVAFAEGGIEWEDPSGKRNRIGWIDDSLVNLRYLLLAASNTEGERLAVKTGSCTDPVFLFERGGDGRVFIIKPCYFAPEHHGPLSRIPSLDLEEVGS